MHTDKQGYYTISGYAASASARIRRMKHDEQNQLLLQVLDEGFERAAWHGPNLRNSIRGLTARQAAWRPGRGRPASRTGRHNIWEIVVHAAYWKYVVRRRILGEKRGSFALKGSNWFRRPVQLSEKAWQRDAALLEDEHRKLRRAVASLSPAALRRSAGRTKGSLLRQTYGIALHDVYHAGQIRLLRRLQRDKSD